jgi:hypothetical protein
MAVTAYIFYLALPLPIIHMIHDVTVLLGQHQGGIFSMPPNVMGDWVAFLLRI